MEISVRQTNLKPSSIKALLANGIVLVSHLNTFDITRLSLKTKLPTDECEKILALIKPKRPHFVTKASDLMSNPFEILTTLIEDLDIILGGGVKCGQLTEISGEAGSGKSNLCTEIGVMVMLPVEKGGKNSNVLLIHTEGEGKLTLALKRFSTLITSMELDCDELIRDKLHVKECINEVELIEIASRMPAFLDSMSEVKLIIIDSMACAFIEHDREPDFDTYKRRDMKLTKVVKLLADIAWERRLAVLITNHVAYDPKTKQNRPALGKIWSHMCQTKIYIERINRYNNIIRYAHVTKGAMHSPEPVRFQISSSLLDS